MCIFYCSSELKVSVGVESGPAGLKASTCEAASQSAKDDGLSAIVPAYPKRHATAVREYLAVKPCLVAIRHFKTGVGKIKDWNR